MNIIPINIMIAEDHELVRKALIALIKGNSKKIEVIGDAENGKALLKLIEKKEPDVVILDLEMPVFNGKETLKVLQVKYPQIKIIILSMHYDDSFVAEYMKRGAHGFLPKNCSAEKLISAIEIVYENGLYFNKKTSLTNYNSFRNDRKLKYTNDIIALTDREIEVLKLVCKGVTSEQIASRLKVSMHTVTFHRVNIAKKTNIKNIAQLTKFAIKNKLI